MRLKKQESAHYLVGFRRRCQPSLPRIADQLASHIRDFQLGVSQPLGLATISVVQSIASLAVAFYHNWQLTLVLLATFPVIAFALSLLSKGLQQAIQQQHSELTSATKQAGNAISNLTVVRCHNTQGSEANTYAQILESLSSHFRTQARIVATQTGFMRFAATGLLVLALFFGDHLIHNAHASPGAVLTTFWCCVTVVKSFNEILTQILVLEKGRAAAMALRDLLRQVDRGNSLSDRSYAQTLSSLEGDIEFKNVCSSSHISFDETNTSRSNSLILPDRTTKFFKAFPSSFLPTKQRKPGHVTKSA